jgi:hypothetical protein
MLFPKSAYVFSPFVLFVVLSVAPTASAQSAEEIERQKRLGLEAWDRLPRLVSLDDAVAFSKALRYFFAYEQLSDLRDRAVDPNVFENMLWLQENIADFHVGKTDEASATRRRSPEELRDRGLDAARRGLDCSR